MCRLLVLGAVLGAISGCGSSKGGRGPYVVERSVCVDASGTVERAPQAPRPEALPGCKTAPDYDLVKSEIQGLCGPCGFSFDKATTVKERATSPTACCYAIASPPPPTR